MRSSIVSRERVAAGDIVNQTFRVIFYWAAGSSRLTGIESKVQRIVLPSISTSLLKNAQYGYQLRRVSKATVVQHLVHSLDSSVLMPGLQSEKTRVTAGLLNLVAGTPCMALQMDSRFLDAPAQNCQRLLDDIASIPHTVQGVCA